MLEFRSTRRSRQRSGFTLIELLVVIAIIAVLVGLLLPAVQKVREAAARLQCQNNLKQLGLAAHNYLDVYGCFPPGAVKQKHFDPVTGAQLVYDRYTWCLLLMPYIEQGNLYNEWVFNYPGNPGVRSSGEYTLPNTGTNAAAQAAGYPFCVASTPVKTLICPSDPGATPMIAAGFGSPTSTMFYPALGYGAGGVPIPAGDPGIMSWGMTSYQGNGGTASYGVLKLYSAAATLDGQNDSRDGTIYLYQYLDGKGGNNHDGRYKVGILDITDGSSNTLMLGEKSLYDPAFNTICVKPTDQNAVLTQSSYWANPSGQDVVAGTEFPLNSSLDKLLVLLQGGCNDGENVSGTSAEQCACDARTTNFSSNHTGGVNFVFCDGSVHFLQDGLSLVTLQALATRAGGEVISGDSY